ncbi:6-phosphogluconolactonase [Paenibacillus hexagrammi]|uniref:6-phosphogluconolactonase n=1 Tax=Paenibacillus hexagrammi TaxID=2908839 RepID=A0ABY3SKX7_9BACL|nr:6-phosphogluconolactonase [Paenibacillus sp. YPD9-1]UJF34709.1 6-phosphogluconolactonase [Paenibacillus sp. YPD9-1]
MNLHIFQNQQELNEAGAGIITSLVQMQPRAVLGLATGGTPVGIYKEIVKAYQKGHISFKGITTFNLDEYVGLPENHPESYRTYMKNHLFDHIDLPLSKLIFLTVMRLTRKRNVSDTMKSLRKPS